MTRPGVSVDRVGTGGQRTPARRETRSRENSRRRLIEAARETFTEHGIRETPVELICERAGFTRGAFYSNFSSKEDLFLAVYEDEIAIRQHRFAEAVAAVEPPAPDDLPALRSAVADMARWYVVTRTGDETWFLLISELRLQALRQPELRPRLEAVLRSSTDEVTAVVEGFVARVGLRLAVDVRYAARAVLALYEDALAENLLAGRPLTADNEFLTEVVPRLLSGLLEWPPSPRSLLP
jgi:AcrR family transcriptional regulator